MSEEYLDQPATDEIELIEVLKALSDPARLAVVRTIADGEFHSCSADVFELDVHKSTLSHHFKVLREAGITSTRSIGRNRDVRLRRDDLNARFPGVIDSLIAAIPAPS
jgi:DNA-binding transcriptional ArsR family regulator